MSILPPKFLQYNRISYCYTSTFSSPFQSEYTETQNGNIEAGLKVLVHDQETPPTVDSAGLAVAPGVHAFIAVKKQQVRERIISAVSGPIVK